jgi:hypothetical protein
VLSPEQASGRPGAQEARELLTSSAPGWVALWGAWVAVWAVGVAIAGSRGDVTDLVVGPPLAWGLARSSRAGVATPLLALGAVGIFTIAFLAGLLNT